MSVKEVCDALSNADSLSEVTIEEGLEEIEREFRDLEVTVDGKTYELEYDNINSIIEKLGGYDSSEFESSKVRTEVMFRLDLIEEGS